MRRTLIAIATLLCASAMPAVTQAENPLQTFAAAVNKRAPYEMTDGMTMLSCSLSDEGLVVVYSLSDALFSSLDFISEMLHDALVAELITSDKPRTLAMVAHLKQYNVSVIHRMTNSGRQYDIVLLPTDL